MDTRTECDTKRSFSIDSLLSNTKENCEASGGAKYAAEERWKEYLPQPEYVEAVGKELAAKNFNVMRHIKSADYLPWITSASSALAHRDFYEEALSNRAAANLCDTSYSNLPLPFVYSSWLPVSGAVRISERTTTENRYACNEHDRVSPREPAENSDSDDSKSDSSKASDGPKDFSCTKQTSRSGE